MPDKTKTTSSSTSFKTVKKLLDYTRTANERNYLLYRRSVRNVAKTGAPSIKQTVATHAHPWFERGEDEWGKEDEN